MYYFDNYLCHYGVLGMKWGQHLMAKYNRGVAREAKVKEGKSKTSKRINNTITATKAVSSLVGAAGGLKGLNTLVQKTLNSQENVKQGLNTITDVINQQAAGKDVLDIFLSDSGKALATRMTIDAFYTQATPVLALGAAALGAYGAYKGVKYISDKYYEKKAHS